MDEEAGIVQLARRLIAIEDGCPASIGTIFSVSDDVPEHFDACDPPAGIQRNSREAKLLQKLYDSKTIVKCHIESCKQTFQGFGQILVRIAAHRRLFKVSAKSKITALTAALVFWYTESQEGREKSCMAFVELENRQHRDRVRNHAGKAMVDDSADARSSASSRSSSDHIEYEDADKCGGTTAIPSHRKANEARGDSVTCAERSSHTTVTHSVGDGSAGDVSREVSSDIREGALSLMKLRYPDEVMPDARRREWNSRRYSRYATRF
ncbi:hypothetical protein FGB62_98g060 [Gracilaria domingensis]|nr:hypothetical protein FGB62_98g060 [Gracilaria domingensis]